MDDPSEKTEVKQSGLIPFVPGQSGNPAGRPKGSRNKLGEAFLEDMLTDWEANGKAAIVACREAKPDVYVKVVASILPKELNVRVSDLDELDDQQLDQRIARLLGALEREAGGGSSVGGTEAAGGSEPSVDLSSVH